MNNLEELNNNGQIQEIRQLQVTKQILKCILRTY